VEMMELIIAFIIGGVIGVMGALIKSSKARFANANLKESKEKIANLEEQRDELNEMVSNLKSQLSVANFSKQSGEQIKGELIKEFELLSNKIMEGNSNKLISTNSAEMDKIISPFKNKVSELEKRIFDSFEKEKIDKLNLKNEVTKLFDLNQKLSIDAANLTNALKGDKKMQGDFGEYFGKIWITQRRRI
jgi:DNA recombination protein RmuC